MKKKSLQSYLPHIVFVFILASVFLGNLSNSHSDKLLRVRNDNLIFDENGENLFAAVVNNCSAVLVSLYQRDYTLCCQENDPYPSFACSSIFDSINHSFSRYAFFLPFLPLCFTLLADFIITISLFFLPVKQFSSKTSMKSSEMNQFLSGFLHGKSKKVYAIYLFVSLFHAAKRALIYSFIILFRVFFLYYFFMQIEYLYNSTFLPNGEPWCVGILSKKRCNHFFDFSDHIVLNILQYITPAVLEALFVLREAKASGWRDQSTKQEPLERHPELSPSHPDNIHYQSHLRLLSILPKPEVSLYFPFRSILYICLPLVCCFIMIFLQLRSIFTTISLFHTNLESIAGSFIGIFFGILPLLFSSIQERWSKFV